MTNSCHFKYKLTLAAFIVLTLSLLGRSMLASQANVTGQTALSHTIIQLTFILVTLLILVPGFFRNNIERLQRFSHLALLAFTLAGIIYGFLMAKQLSNYALLPLFLLLLPLIVSMPGLLRQSVYTFQWSLFLAIFYFMHGSTDAVSLNTHRTGAIIETIASIILFTGLILCIRCRRKTA